MFYCFSGGGSFDKTFNLFSLQLQNSSAVTVWFRALLASLSPSRPQAGADMVPFLLGIHTDSQVQPTVGKIMNILSGSQGNSNCALNGEGHRARGPHCSSHETLSFSCLDETYRSVYFGVWLIHSNLILKRCADMVFTLYLLKFTDEAKQLSLSLDFFI